MPFTLLPTRHIDENGNIRSLQGLALRSKAANAAISAHLLHVRTEDEWPDSSLNTPDDAFIDSEKGIYYSTDAHIRIGRRGNDERGMTAAFTA